MYERFLPSFAVVEINNSTAHRIGHAISQVPAYAADVATKTVGNYKFVENGIIVGFDLGNKLVNYDAKQHAQPCLVYNDELITGPIDSLDKYAEEIEDGKPVYVRALPLYIGDSFTTDKYTGTLPTSGHAYAKVDNGVLAVSASYTDGVEFLVEASTLPNGKPAGAFTFVGKVAPKAE